MRKELDCVVVTDHNSGAWIDVLKNKYQELSQNKLDWFRELTIFPGVEITVADSSNRVHLLAIFDPSCDSQTVTSVLGGCGINAGFGDDENTSTNTGFVETVNKIAVARGIAIPAHIDGRKGLLEGITALTPELIKSLQSISAAEFCDLHKFDNADAELKKQVDGLAKLAGSDAHKPDDIGKHSSWLKMSRPSIEGLRLALLDHEFCVKNQAENPNCVPDVYLVKLTIQFMRHCGRIPGQPLTLQLHPHFNVLIGGRGTGKSTILEAIRIAARREDELKPFPKLEAELIKFLRGQTGMEKERGVMLDTTEIMLGLSRNSINYRLRWRFDAQQTVLEQDTTTGWQAVETGNLKERFPLSIYSQKQINELALNPKGLLEVIDRSLEVNRTEWQNRWETEKSTFLQLKGQQRELRRQLATEEPLRARLRDVEHDLNVYEEQGHGEILKTYQKRQQQKNSLPSNHIFDGLTSKLHELAESAQLSDFPEHLFDDEDQTKTEMQAIHDWTAQELNQVSTVLLQLVEKLAEIKTQREQKNQASLWFHSLQKSEVDYASLPPDSSQYGKWVQQRNSWQQELQRLASVRKDIDTIDNQLNKSLQKLIQLRTELLEKRRTFLDKVIGSNEFVRMELVQFGDTSCVEEDYRSLLTLQERVFTNSIYEHESKQGLLWELCQWETLNKPEAELAQLIAAVKNKTIEIAKGLDTGNHGAFNNRLKQLWENQPNVFEQLETWYPEDLLRVKYAREPASGRFVDLEKGSAGQKAAAILAFLLSHGSDPLIIDQPEDDLDNALIYDLIVKQIHLNKSKRQLIIVTHNPNIAVNGDAELVHVLKFENGQMQVEQQGGLEELPIRAAICRIMEGGNVAFEKRYQRIRPEQTHVI
ncbi:MAG: histidinol phosphatase [Methylobacter sp.]|nr:MAG: histidinol phosphatase [Methylobacter sp.]